MSQVDMFADLSGWRKVAVSGPDALEWLNDLVSADLSRLSPGRAARSLLLSPTGGVRAEFTAVPTDDGFLLLQDPGQRSVLDLLSPYTLSSDVALEDRTDRFALLAIPNRARPLEGVKASASTPSCLGPGLDLIAPASEAARLVEAVSISLVQATEDQVEAWRVLAGLPRLGVDVIESDLPQEAGLEAAVAFDKGCYLGQEAVAKVRNLGHPRRLLLPIEADAPVSAGDLVLADGREAGTLTSVAVVDGRSLGLARIGWAARVGPFLTAGGVALSVRPTQSPV